MGRKVNPMEKVLQKSISFPFRQHLFFARFPDFKPDEFCRQAVDKQISLLDPSFLSKEGLEEQEGQEEPKEQ